LGKGSFSENADQTAAGATASRFPVRDRHLGIQTAIKSCELRIFGMESFAHPAARTWGILLEQLAGPRPRRSFVIFRVRLITAGLIGLRRRVVVRRSRILKAGQRTIFMHTDGVV